MKGNLFRATILIYLFVCMSFCSCMHVIKTVNGVRNPRVETDEKINHLATTVYKSNNLVLDLKYNKPKFKQ